MTTALILAIVLLAFYLGAMALVIVRDIVYRQYRRKHIKITTENNTERR